MSRNSLEIWVGVFVAIGIAALAMLAFKVGDLSNGGATDGFKVTALFDNIGGLKTKAPVTMAGVRVGRVTNIVLKRDSFRAEVELTLDGGFDNIPEDSSASILTSGLLGDQYVGLEPGGSVDSLKQGSVILTTSSALVLERLIGQLLFDKAGESGDAGASDAK
jgi:phospholipid/cholesterol/gamma-HCH transport system substrate-binding protein